MARPREFDEGEVLDRAIGAFREHGYEGTSAQMLVTAMGIGRQSIYDTFGDKWRLYCAAVRRYGTGECAAHVAALNSSPRAIDGIAAVLDRVVETARAPCLGIGSTCEFGTDRPDLVEINGALAAQLRAAIADGIARAQRAGDVATDLEPGAAAEFLMSTITGIRMAGRGGANGDSIASLATMAMRALK